MLGYFLTKLFRKDKNYYNDDCWSFIDGLDNDWKDTKNKKKRPKYKRKRSPIEEKFKTPNPYENLVF